jgi:hypothetical protein
MLLLARVQLPGLHKEICRWWESNQRSFLMLLLARVHPSVQPIALCRARPFYQHSLFPEATASTRSAAWATPADYINGTVRSTHPSLAALLASPMPGEVNEV